MRGDDNLMAKAIQQLIYSVGLFTQLRLRARIAFTQPLVHNSFVQNVLGSGEKRFMLEENNRMRPIK